MLVPHDLLVKLVGNLPSPLTLDERTYVQCADIPAFVGHVALLFQTKCTRASRFRTQRILLQRLLFVRVLFVCMFVAVRIGRPLVASTCRLSVCSL